MAAPAFPLQVFYDGSCSVCAKEMGIYRQKGHAGRLVFTDISAPDFDPAPYRLDLADFMRVMHAIDRQGRIFRGIDAFRAVWCAFPDSFGYRSLSTLIALPGVHALARLAYLGFARLRKYLPKNRDACADGSCRLH